MERSNFGLVLFLLIILMNAFPNVGLAQNKSEEPKKKHTLNFEDELIEGDVQKPDLLYLLERKNFNFKKLIKLRENFLPEMVETSDLVKGSGSNR